MNTKKTISLSTLEKNTTGHTNSPEHGEEQTILLGKVKHELLKDRKKGRGNGIKSRCLLIKHLRAQRMGVLSPGVGPQSGEGAGTSPNVVVKSPCRIQAGDVGAHKAISHFSRIQGVLIRGTRTGSTKYQQEGKHEILLSLGAPPAENAARPIPTAAFHTYLGIPKKEHGCQAGVKNYGQHIV